MGRKEVVEFSQAALPGLKADGSRGLSLVEATEGLIPSWSEQIKLMFSFLDQQRLWTEAKEAQPSLSQALISLPLGYLTLIDPLGHKSHRLLTRSLEELSSGIFGIALYVNFAPGDIGSGKYEQLFQTVPGLLKPGSPFFVFEPKNPQNTTAHALETRKGLMENMGLVERSILTHPQRSVNIEGIEGFLVWRARMPKEREVKSFSLIDAPYWLRQKRREIERKYLNMGWPTVNFSYMDELMHRVGPYQAYRILLNHIGVELSCAGCRIRMTWQGWEVLEGDPDNIPYSARKRFAKDQTEADVHKLVEEALRFLGVEEGSRQVVEYSKVRSFDAVCFSNKLSPDQLGKLTLVEISGSCQGCWCIGVMASLPRVAPKGPNEDWDLEECPVFLVIKACSSCQAQIDANITSSGKSTHR